MFGGGSLFGSGCKLEPDTIWTPRIKEQTKDLRVTG